MRGPAILQAVRWPAARRKASHPYREQSITDALKALPQEPPPAKPEPSFTSQRPDPLRQTGVIPELSVPRPPAAAPADDEPEVAVLQKVLDGLNGLDWEALDAARDSERETYARTTGAPFHNALLKEQRTPLGDPQRPAWRPPAGPVRRHGDAVMRRLGDLEWPAVSGFTDPGADDLYAEFLRRVSVITGTAGLGNWRPVTGGAR